jgi:hypothetical protein
VDRTGDKPQFQWITDFPCFSTVSTVTFISTDFLYGNQFGNRQKQGRFGIDPVLTGPRKDNVKYKITLRQEPDGTLIITIEPV